MPYSSNPWQILSSHHHYQMCLVLNAPQVKFINVLNGMFIYKLVQRISNVHYLKCFGWDLSNGLVIRPPISWALFLYIWVPFFVGLYFFLFQTEPYPCQSSDVNHSDQQTIAAAFKIPSSKCVALSDSTHSSCLDELLQLNEF